MASFRCKCSFKWTLKLNFSLKAKICEQAGLFFLQKGHTMSHSMTYYFPAQMILMAGDTELGRSHEEKVNAGEGIHGHFITKGEMSIVLQGKLTFSYSSLLNISPTVHFPQGPSLASSPVLVFSHFDWLVRDVGVHFSEDCEQGR